MAKKTANQRNVGEFVSFEEEEGITWITSAPKLEIFVTVDKYERIYFNSKAMELLGLGHEVFIGYDFANRRLIIANPETVRPANVKPHRIDKRGYTSARQFLRRLSLSKADLPLRFEYIGKDYTVKGAHAFAMDGYLGEDGGL